MRKDFGAKPMLYPMPVLIIGTYGEDGTPNAMNAAWGGISNDRELSLCISAGHKTTKSIEESGAFTVNIADVPHLVSCDYVGIVSGNTVPDKFERAGFHALPSPFVDAPVIEELPISVECRLISYDPSSCRLVGEIVNVSVDERVLDENGRVDVQRLRPLTFDPFNNQYVALGEIVGKAFSDGKKRNGDL